MIQKIPFIILLVLSNLWCYSQLSIDRKSLRNNNKILQESVYYAKSNYTSVDISKNFKTKIRKLDFLGKIFDLIDNKNKVHLLVNETISKTYCTNYRNIQSFGLESKSAGVILPKLSVLLSQAESFSLYKDYLTLGGRKFLSPLYNPKFYNIKSSTDQDTLIVFFEARKNKKYLLDGIYKLNLENEQIISFQGNNNKKGLFSFYYKAKEINGNYYPHSKKTKVELGEKQNILINSYSTYFDYRPFHTKLKYNSIVLDNDKYFKEQTDQVDSTKLDSLFGNEFSQTKSFFSNLTGSNSPEEIFEDLYLISEGKLPFKYGNIRLNRLINFNPYEGIRLGLGMETNESLSKNFIIGGYYGFGFLDQENKIGGDFTYILDQYSKTLTTFKFDNTLTEPGAVIFSLSKKLFGNEGFRKFGLENIQRQKSVNANISTEYFKWIVLETGFENGTITPYYDYTYLPENLSSNFNYSNWHSTIRVTPREKFIKSYNNLLSIGSKYPTIWLNGEIGKASGIPYTKYNFKIEKKFKFVVYGDFTMEIIGGYINKDLPYPFLYNMQGSYNPFTPIIGNSFMTMGYNEFIADNYTAFFLNHNFGELLNNPKYFHPELVLLHNMGFGSLRSPSNHDLTSVNTISKGYYESGLYFRNLILLQNILGKSGIGVGCLYRYGPYRNPKSSDNFVVKFALDFQI